MARLRAPDGCPWDREQTRESLTRYLVEECYEAVDAIESGDTGRITEELGDLLLQIIFQSQLGAEEGVFDVDDVCRGICEKLIRRHPHVFADTQVTGSAEVLRNWEEIKKTEHGGDAENPISVLAGVPNALPALDRAQAVQKKAAAVGFDWDDIDGPMGKVQEEVDELAAAITAGRLDGARQELGDVLFASVNVARFLKVDAASALRGTLRKFAERFAYIERHAAEQGRSLDDMTLREMDDLWDQAKHDAGQPARTARRLRRTGPR